MTARKAAPANLQGGGIKPNAVVGKGPCIAAMPALAAGHRSGWQLGVAAPHRAGGRLGSSASGSVAPGGSVNCKTPPRKRKSLAAGVRSPRTDRRRRRRSQQTACSKRLHGIALAVGAGIALHLRNTADAMVRSSRAHVQARAGEAMMHGGHTRSATGISEHRQWYARPRRWRIHWRSSPPLTTTGSRERTHKRL